MCDRIAIIDKGNLVALDTTQKLLDRIQTKKITLKTSKPFNLKNLVLPGVQFKSDNDNVITATYEKNSFKFNIFGLFSTIAKVLKPNELSIDVFL